MTQLESIGLSEVEKFVKKELPKLIENDLKALRLVREADVQCAAYMYLRMRLDSDPNWHVLAEFHAPQTSKFIDLVLLQKSVPRIAIEIKWGRKNMGMKDRQSLSTALTNLGVNKAYWLSASVLGEPPPRLEKSAHEKNLLHQVVVRPNLDEAELLRWKKLRTDLRRKPQDGKGRAKGVSDDAGVA